MTLGPQFKKKITYPVDTGGRITRTQAAERMYGTGSKQHKLALKKYGK